MHQGTGLGKQSSGIAYGFVSDVPQSFRMDLEHMPYSYKPVGHRASHTV